MTKTDERQSPGFRRMKERLGPDAAERLRLDTIRLQEEALASVRPARPFVKEESADFQVIRDTIKGKR